MVSIAYILTVVYFVSTSDYAVHMNAREINLAIKTKFAEREIEFAYPTQNMLSRLTQINFHGQTITIDNSFQYGSVCIAKSLRGRVAFHQLFATMRSNLAKRYPISITFIN